MAQSRVQKGKSKKSKFPMWGIAIIVVAVVAVAGYAIIRFSQASTGTAYKKVNTGMVCNGTRVDKGGTTGSSCVLKVGQMASATWSKSEQGTNTIRCANLFFGYGSKAAMRYRVTGNLLGVGDFTSNWKYQTGNNANATMCTDSMSNYDRSNWITSKNVTLEVKSEGGTVSVKSMYLRQ